MTLLNNRVLPVHGQHSASIRTRTNLAATLISQEPEDCRGGFQDCGLSGPGFGWRIARRKLAEGGPDDGRRTSAGRLPELAMRPLAHTKFRVSECAMNVQETGEK